MTIQEVLAGIVRIAARVAHGLTWRTSWTGGNMKDPKALSAAQDEVFANPSYQPQDGTTFCNVATQDVLLEQFVESTLSLN